MLKKAWGIFAYAGIVAAVTVTPAFCQQPDKINSDVPYSVAVGLWAPEMGNHRARISVSKAADAVRVHLPWRLRDRNIDKKNIIIRDSSTMQPVKNVLRVNINREFGELIFQPPTAPGKYDVFFDPHVVQMRYRGYSADYPKPVDTADAGWVQKVKSTLDQNNSGNTSDFPSADVIDFQSRTIFDSYYPMEVIATADEISELLTEHTDAYILYPERQDFKIKMPDDIPLRWIRTSPNSEFSGDARVNEYYEFQIGVYAARQNLKDVKLTFTPLKGSSGATIPASALNSINLGGIDPDGNPFIKRVDVEKNTVQALWVGVDISKNAVPDTYRGTITVSPANSASKSINIVLKINLPVLADRGDSEPWHYSRLRWLDSKIGIDDSVAAPYTPLEVNGNEVKCLGRSVRFGEDGFPLSIKSGKTEILAQPIRFSAGDLALIGGPAQIIKKAAGLVTVHSTRTGGGLTVDSVAIMEFDGNINYQVTLTADKRINLKDISLDLPMRSDIATYLMGIGQGAAYCPKSYSWRWDGPYNSFWLGDVSAGLHLKLLGASYSGPMLNLYHPAPPVTWSNGGKGGVSIDQKTDVTLARAFSGNRILEAGKPITFELALLITPVKPLDTAKHFSERYYHDSANPAPVDSAVAAGVNVINVHTGNALNPYINYPFNTAKPMRDFVQTWHAKNMKVKIYYTVRELSNYTNEMWALRSLQDEVIADGPGGGFSWLREHLVSDYTPRWYMPFQDGTADASILTSSESRWLNYYVQSIDWLIKNVGVDGIYLDDVAYDRRILKRVRKVMDAAKPGCPIDLHSNMNFSIVPANQYMDYFPFIDRLWFGEGFNYERMRPEQWLVESSGIPFGLMGDMLKDGGNRWRGMIYGMSVRLMVPKPNADYDPKPIWKLCDEFGIADSKMIGYWDKTCPVRTDNKDVLATAYVKDGKTLISIASWARDRVNVHLQINWKSLGLNPTQATLSAPAIKDFQEEKSFAPTDAISVQPAKGWLIIAQ